jgi:hypothetical protein
VNGWRRRRRRPRGRNKKGEELIDGASIMQLVDSLMCHVTKETRHAPLHHHINQSKLISIIIHPFAYSTRNQLKKLLFSLSLSVRSE